MQMLFFLSSVIAFSFSLQQVSAPATQNPVVIWSKKMHMKCQLRNSGDYDLSGEALWCVVLLKNSLGWRGHLKGI